MNRCSTLFCAVVVSLTISIDAAPASDIVYDFRGATLGMPLYEFRKLDIPSMDDGPSIIVCSGDKWTRREKTLLKPTSPRKDGWTVCQLQAFNKTFKAWSLAIIKIGPSSGQPIFSFFPDKQDSEPRLFLIQSTFNSNAFPDIEAGLTERFGSPSLSEKIISKNGLGMDIPNQISVWKSGQASVILRKIERSIGQGSLVYDLQNVREKALKASDEALHPRSNDL